MRSEQWVVVGASGFVGRHVAAAARDAGAVVRELSAPRLTAPSEGVPDTLIRLATDPQDGSVAATAGALVGADVVVNCAGLAAPDAPASPELTGANALLPAVLLAASPPAARFVHLSSAAVQGNRPRLDESPDTSPASPYAVSKALGEATLLAMPHAAAAVIVRATSVQGSDRATTRRLRRVAGSPLASVAAPGDQPTPVTSVSALAQLVVAVARHPGDVPPIVLQPWEGMTTSAVLRVASGGREPRQLPAGLCRALVRTGHLATRLLGGRFVGAVRRIEVMWFGQGQEPGWCERTGVEITPRVVDALTPGGHA